MALSHQNIVPVFDFGRAGDELFLAMEYVDGRDLATALSRARERGVRIAPTLAAFIGAECCAALAYAHEMRFDDGTIGVVHRDVTPRNILLSWSGEVRLTDFGVAALRREDIAVIRGTPHYMAPEQARGEGVDARADLYSLAMVLHEAVTGTRVRSADPEAAFEEARVGDLPPLPDDLPIELVAVIARATSPRPEHRFADARELQDALAEIARGARGAPGRILADWLNALFPDRAGEPASDPHLLEAVTFLDDGEAALLGTGTARSIAETALEPVPAPAPPAPAPAPRASRAPKLALVGALLAGGAALAWSMTRSDPPRDAAPAAAPDAAERATTSPPVDAAVAAAPPDAAVVIASAPLDAAPAAERPRDASPRDGAPRVRTPKAAASPPDAGAATPAATRQVTIGSRPWSAFYVDGESMRHETPETLSLSPGRHRIRFVNEEAGIDREISLEVPEDRDVKHVEILVPDNH
jgi:hypothetical protein